jgi:sugar lactone lactonase YvrE
VRSCVLALFAAACGRVGFDPRGAGDASSDAPISPPAGVYFADDGLVHRIDFVTGAKTTVIDTLGNPNGLTFNANRTTLYISDDAGDRIFAADAADGFTPRLVHTAASRIEGLVLDAAGSTIYYAAKQDSEVWAVGTDGSAPRMLRAGIPAVDGVAFDSVNDTVYVTSATDGFIARMRSDGSDFAMVATGVDSPEGIAVDAAAGHVYFVDAFDVRRMDLDGANQISLVSGLEGGEGLSLDLVHGHVYWSDSGLNDVGRANLDGSEAMRIQQGLVVVEDVAVGP